MRLLVSEFYIYQNARCNNKKNQITVYNFVHYLHKVQKMRYLLLAAFIISETTGCFSIKNGV